MATQNKRCHRILERKGLSLVDLCELRNRKRALAEVSNIHYVTLHTRRVVNQEPIL